MIFLALTSAFAGEPTVSVSWRGADGQLSVDAPAGWHVNEDAPVDLTVRWEDRVVTVQAPGHDLAPIPLRKVVGTTVNGVVNLSVCDDAKTTCKPVSLEVSGDVPMTKKGQVALVEVHAAAHPSPFKTDADATAREVYERAKKEGKLVLLDFGAVWCPPCNVLSAEVLEADPPPVGLENYVVAAIDVDHASSWTLKDTYAVGGYPTVILTDPQGVELSRTEGYPGKETFLDWLDEVATARTPDPDPASLDPSTLAGPEAAAIAVSLFTSHGGDARPFLERARSEAPDHPTTRHAILLDDPTVENAEWMVTHAPSSGIDWVFDVPGLQNSDDGKAVLLDAVRAGLLHASLHEASDLLYMAAKIDPENQALYAASGVAMVQGALTGDSARDRGYITWLARLMADASDLSGGLSLLTTYAESYPEEPTFWLSGGNLLVRAERYEDALVWYERALATAWDDNRLRVVTQMVNSLVALGRIDEARALGTREIEAAAAPDDALEVRTHRYRKALEAALPEE